jgi:TRAP-type C4-dicarboxylate transport system permease large subunit/TRAP-type C4-dicarboxylate transport system permease small subunit
MTSGKNNGNQSSGTAPGLVERIERALQAVEGGAIFVLMIVLVGMTFCQVVLRNLPGNPSAPWIDLASRLLVLWVGLLGASLAMARKKHISIDIAGRLLPDRFLPWVKGGTGLLSLLVITALVHASLAFTHAKYATSSLPLFTIEILDLEVFEWVFTDLVPPIFLIMLWHAWVQWRRDLGTGRAGRILSWVGGAAVLMSLLAILVINFGWAELDGITGFMDGSFGLLLRNIPVFFILISLLLAILGAPLFVVIAAVALIGHYALEEIPVQNFVADGIGGFRKSTIFLAIPLFTLAGYLMAEGGTPKRLVGLFRGFLGWMPGGVAIVALIACSFFTAFTGASGVTIIALGGLLLPILLEDKYPEKFSLGLLTTGGSRGLIFPPAIPVFLLAMIMGLSWDAVTATGPFGSAVLPAAQKMALCEQQIEDKRQELILDEKLSAGDAKMEDELDRLLAEKLAAEGIGSTDGGGTSGDEVDEFELGDDDNFGGEDEEPADEFELGDDDNFGSEDKQPVDESEPADEFELGDDDNFVADEDSDDTPPDEFELGDDDSFAGAKPEADKTDDKAGPDDDDLALAVAGATGESTPDDTTFPTEPEDIQIPVPSSTQIFTAGLIPGLLMIFSIAIFCIIMGFRSKVLRTRFSARGAGQALLGARWELPIPLLIGIGIFGGFFTPAEAASATAAYTLFMQLVLYRDFGIKTLVRTFIDSMVLVGGILIILVAAMGLLNFLVVAKVPDAVLAMIENIIPEELPVLGLFVIPRQIVFLLMLNLFLLVVGCLMDIFSAILVVLPLLLPLAWRFGIHPAHLAVIFLTNLEIGYSTPPVGINLFVASLRFERPVVKLYAASLAYLAIMFAGLLVITYWPGLSLWLVHMTGVQ